MSDRDTPSEPSFVLGRPGPIFRRLFYAIGAVVVAAGSMVPAAIASAIYREWEVAGWILLSSPITVASGLFGWRVLGRSGTLTTKEGFATVGLAWLAMSCFWVLPLPADGVDRQSGQCRLRDGVEVHDHRGGAGAPTLPRYRTGS